uniref:Ankyrin repeat protein n=1 Tax=viral metagenome TaxID=1070528 RepID=A0A6C0C7G2_9ZZZZ
MNSPLLNAYKTQNFQEFEQLLASGKISPDINLGLGQNKKQNLLVFLCNSLDATPTPHKLTFVELLLRYGADPNIACHPPSVGYTAPLVAVLSRLNHGEHLLAYFKLLLGYGADPNFPKNMVNTIAYTDTGNYCVTALQYALEAGADKNVPINSLGWKTIDGLNVRIAEPPKYNVRNVSVLIDMRKLLESFGAISANLFNTTRNNVRANIIAARNVYVQNQQQIENQKRAEEQRKMIEQQRIAAEQQRIAAEQQRIVAEQQRIVRERTERERLEKERIERERIERERIENERIERIERERIENERIKRERERLENEKIENERIENERIENERIENERIENERIERERQEEQLRSEKSNKIKADLALRYLSWAIDNITYLGKNNEFITQQKDSTDEDSKEFIAAIESFRTCTSSILLKSGNLMPPEILAQLSIPQEYSEFFQKK